MLSNACTVKPRKPLVLLLFHNLWNHHNCMASIPTHCLFKSSCDTPDHQQALLWISRGLGSYFKTGSFVGLTWLHDDWYQWRKGNILFLARSMWNHVIFWVYSYIQWIVVSFIHYWYIAKIHQLVYALGLNLKHLH